MQPLMDGKAVQQTGWNEIQFENWMKTCEIILYNKSKTQNCLQIGFFLKIIIQIKIYKKYIKMTKIIILEWMSLFIFLDSKFYLVWFLKYMYVSGLPWRSSGSVCASCL